MLLLGATGTKKKATRGSTAGKRGVSLTASKANKPKSSPSKTAGPLKKTNLKAPKIASSAQFAKGNANTKKMSAPAKKTGKTLSAFETAFATARKGGRETFRFGGKEFHTRLKGEKKKKK